MVRFDQILTSKTTAFFRVNVDESVTDNPLGNLRDRTVADARPINGVLALNQILSPSTLNQVRAGFNLTFVDGTSLKPGSRSGGFSPIQAVRPTGP